MSPKTAEEAAATPAEYRPQPLNAARELQLLLLTLGLTAAVYAKAALGPLQETLRIALSLSDHQIALLQGPALALPITLVSVPLGLAVDRYSRVHLILGGVLLLLVGSLLTAFASSFAMLVAG